jgi:DNA-binding transcriptional LysR family regulator
MPNSVAMSANSCSALSSISGEHDCLRYRFETSGGFYRWAFVRDARLFEIDVDGRFVTNDLRRMVDAALRGVGLLHVIDEYVTQPLADDRLIRVLDDWCPTFPGFLPVHAEPCADAVKVARIHRLPAIAAEIK